MKKYIVTIEETVSEAFEVMAENDKEAQLIAEKKYKSGEFVLAPGNLTCKQMEIQNVTNDYYIDWLEF